MILSTHSAEPHPHSRHRNRAQASAKRPRSRGVKRLAAPPRIGGRDSQPRPSGPTKPGGPQEPGAGRHAMCPGEEATRRQPIRPDGRGLFAAIPMPRLDRNQNLRDHRIPACRKARCRVRIDAGRSTRQPDRTGVRPVGDTGKPQARLSRGVPSGRWPRTSWRQRRLSTPKPRRIVRVGA